MNEVWKDIPKYEGYYQASNLGRIKSLKRFIKHRGYDKIVNERILKPGLSKDGYLMVVLCKDKKKLTQRVHRLIMLTFKGYSDLEVDHINEIKTDNRLCNLRYLDKRRNKLRSVKNNTSKYKGVHWDKQNKKWRTAIYIDKRHYFIGLFYNEKQAHIAYNETLNNWERYKKLPK